MGSLIAKLTSTPPVPLIEVDTGGSCTSRCCDETVISEITSSSSSCLSRGTHASWHEKTFEEETTEIYPIWGAAQLRPYAYSSGYGLGGGAMGWEGGKIGKLENPHPQSIPLEPLRRMHLIREHASVIIEIAPVITIVSIISLLHKSNTFVVSWISHK